MSFVQRLRRNLERNLFGKDPQYHDPYEDPGEQFYARIYLKYLFEQTDRAFRHQSLRILDIGCHTGRLSIPLARAGHDVTGIDSSRFHVKRAEQHAQKEKVHCRFVAGDGFRWIDRTNPGSFDLVLCTEVLYQRRDFRDCFWKLLQAVRPGGLLATSHRTRFFYLSRAVRERDFATAQEILNQSEGEIWNSYFNWQTPDELKGLYEAVGLDLLVLHPIGTMSGQGEEGMAALCDLRQLDATEREAFFEIEAFDSGERAGMGRYLFAIGRKPES